MPVTVRSASEADMPFVYRLICELEECSFEFSLFAKYYLGNISAINHLYLVAVNENNTVVGFLSCHGQLLLHHCGLVFEIQELFVDSEFRNKGIGKMLMNSLEERLGKQPYLSLEVTTNSKRTDTHLFYKSLGFTETHKKFTKEKIVS